MFLRDNSVAQNNVSRSETWSLLSAVRGGAPNSGGTGDMIQKVLALGGLNWMALANGFLYGHVGSVIGALQKNEEGINLSDGQISMIATTLTLTMVIGFALVAAITDRFGPRWPYVVFSAFAVINWIILYFAREMYQFMLSRIIAGISAGAIIMLNIYVTAEYTPPETRAMHLNMITTVTPAIGTGLAHAIGIVLHWRTVTLIGILFSGLGLVLPYFWVESPHWLASKGRFEECEIAFRKLHGNNSERELKLLVKMETTKLKIASERNRISTFKRLFAAFKRKYFWGLLFLNIVMNVYLVATGKFAFSMLATVMLQEITGTSDVLLFTLLVDGFILLGSCLSCFLITKTSMRALLFYSGFIDNAVLVLFSIFHFFKNGETYFNWINVTLLALYFIIGNAGSNPIVEALFGEMFPLELKMYMFCMSSVVFIAVLSLSISLIPPIVAAMGYHGLFLLNAAIMSMCLGYTWLMLPETKGKTLQEIEMYFKTNNFNIEEELSKEQIKSLV